MTAVAGAARAPDNIFVHYSQARQDWETPSSVFDPLHAEFHFTLDVAASRQNTKVPNNYISAETDGLAADWFDNVCWMNPPYGNQIRLWMRKAYESSRAGATVVCLVPSRTDTDWWHDYAMRGEVRFIRHRVAFVRADGQRSRAPFPSAIVVFRP